MPTPRADVGRASTPERIVEAAAAEFARYGLAGARVDRIAERAEANKQRIYAYFGGKEALFDQVVAARILDLMDAVPFDADDLPGYAARLFDFAVGGPDFVRLVLWHTLERPGGFSTSEQSAASSTAKVSALREAQARHPERIDPAVPADRLLAQVLAAVLGSVLTVGGLLSALGEPEIDVDDVRADVRRSVTRIIATRA
ncbi:transcriptional regulator, TetR family [Promicromonospora umidemergens]|uniref:TetR family transcriptional regulator n=1 Tax=Promicromonospora umidemergens TaxID=629679 RepID=A0ABP8XXW9_9MICO|nr:TetR family transcriptional regulator [Promicromonospora umidemergens]MCP2286071.1 transcriptional regulator, TetR family [Promicromonospora umidemergens]